MMKVVDASVLVELLGEGEYADGAERAVGREQLVLAPALIDAEVGHALRRDVRAERISAHKARAALGELFELRLLRVPHRLLVDRAWELRHNVIFYDGLYVALAEAMQVPLLTLDRKLARAPGLRVEVELIAPV